MLFCVVNVALEPTHVERTPHLERVLRSCHDCASCRERNQPEGWPLHRRLVRLPRSQVTLSGSKGMVSKAFLLIYLRTLAPATPLFSNSSLKHPGVAWAPSNPCPLFSLRTALPPPRANAPYPWAIALCFARCHNPLLGWLTAQRSLSPRTSPGQETFLCSVVSNRVSGRGLGAYSPSEVPRGPKQGRGIWAVRVGESQRGPVRPRASSTTGRTRKADRVRLG